MHLDTKLPWAYPLGAITSPTYNQNIGSSLIGLLKLLFQTPVTEVRRACFEALRNDKFGSSGYKHFQGEEKHSLPAHELVQSAIIAVAHEDLDAAMTIVRHYLADTWSAYQVDERHCEHFEAVESEIMFSKALKFIARVFLVEKPKHFRWGKLEGNPLYLEPKLLEQLLLFFEKKRRSGNGIMEISLALRAVARKLRQEIASDATMDSERWAVYELVFRHACKSWDQDQLMRYPAAAQRAMTAIAREVIDGRVSFECDGEFGELLKERAKAICYQFLWRFSARPTEEWLKERYGLCKAKLVEMGGEEVLHELRNIMGIMRYCPNMFYAHELEDRRVKLLEHLSRCVNFMSPLSQGEPVMR